MKKEKFDQKYKELNSEAENLYRDKYENKIKEIYRKFNSDILNYLRKEDGSYNDYGEVEGLIINRQFKLNCEISSTIRKYSESKTQYILKKLLTD
ncbi:MAG: hypothetical protein M3Z82_02525 [Apilactobacillus sp.]|nr:hypothetical protein [Apilactobacillus sp.]